MSHDFHHHHGIFSFSDHAPPDVAHAPPEPVYETAGMLSEMLNFGGAVNHNNNPSGMQFFLADPPPRSPATHALLLTQHHEFLNWADPEGGNPRGLSLSLSSAKAEEEFRFMHLQGYGIGQNNSSSGHFGFGSTLAAPSVSLGAVNALRSSKFLKPTQELLEEFCSVGRGNLKKINKFARNDSISSTTSSGGGGGGGGPSSSNSGKDLPALTQSDRVEHQRRKVKLLAMLDEVERRYSQYCEQMQMVVNSYDVVMGYGAAIPYTALAQKAMSRHFRCLKDAIHAQLKHSCELLGDKDVSASTGLTKGETPRLKVLEQSLRQQRAFHQMGMMEQEAWRPQRGLPERSVNVLRAWLFEHFLNPYPSDADKHLLARQTGLSRNQVSNWFINARVRLWKPMVEDMYQQESKDDDQEDDEDDQEQEEDQARETNDSNAQTSMSSAKRSVINSSENDPSFFAIQAPVEFAGVWAPPAGDVSLTLGLRHSAADGGQPEKSGFSFREFGS